MAKFFTCRWIREDTKMCLLPTVDGQHCDQHKEFTVKRGRGRPRKNLITVKEIEIKKVISYNSAFEEWNNKPLYPTREQFIYTGGKIWP